MAKPTVARDPRCFYVYVIFRPTGIPCYVGKGNGRRWEVSAHRAKSHYLRRIADAAGGHLPVVKVRENLTEDDAFATEIALIAAIGRIAHGGPLVNHTDGGEGTAGASRSADAIAKTAAALRGLKHSEASRARMRAAHLGETRSPEHRAAIGAAHLGRRNSPETIALMRAVAVASGRRPPPLTEEVREKLSAASKSWVRPPDYGAKISVAKKGKKRQPFSPEWRAKISAGMKAFRAQKKAEMALGNPEGIG